MRATIVVGKAGCFTRVGVGVGGAGGVQLRRAVLKPQPTRSAGLGAAPGLPRRRGKGRGGRFSSHSVVASRVTKGSVGVTGGEPGRFEG